jgi:hypothetical protein
MGALDIIRHHWRRLKRAPPQVQLADLERIDRSGQVIHCDVVPARRPPRLQTLGQLAGATGVTDYLPAALLAQKAKNVCHGILAALEDQPSEDDEFVLDRFGRERPEHMEVDAPASGVTRHESIQRVYERRLRRLARVTNPFASGVWRARSLTSSAPADERALSPSVGEFFDAIQFGFCNAQPAMGDGFYAYVLHALTALLRPDRTPEARRRGTSEDYAKEVHRFVASFFFQPCEPHVKKVIVVPPGARAGHFRYLTPGLTLEPLPTYYSLTADAFRFLRTVVEERRGQRALDLAQWRESGPVEATIGSGIDEVVELYDCAAKLSLLEIQGHATGDGVDAMRARLLRLFADPDVTRDARGMVPLGLTEDNTQVRVVVFAGWDVHRLTAELTSIDGELPDGVALGTEAHPIPLPIVQEMTMPAELTLSREEMLARCDVMLQNAPPTFRWSQGFDGD